jgi:adenine-specific DNA-methyltransferase
MNKQDLISKIKQLEDISQDERAYLINLVNTKKKYGLVWEDKPEDVEEQLRDNLPVLKERKDKAIINGEDFPNHILIEGDNLHVLTALTFTHEGKIDVIYIDPPYNTKNKDFKYNDTFVDKEDAFRHSKWLSFMHKRLQIAKKLLVENGVIFISIDDNEQSQLKLLCDEVFGEANYLQNVIWQKHAGGGNDSRFFAVDHEYVICYSKSILNLDKFRIPLTEDEKKDYKLSDENIEILGKYKTKSFKRMRPDDPRPGLQYNIVAPDGTLLFDEWKWEESKFLKALKQNRVLIRKNAKKEWSVEYKLYLKASDDEDADDDKQKVPRSLLTKIERNSEGKKQLSDVFPGKTIFNNPKPLELIKLWLNTKASKSIKILDFFAGSGTTLHATMDLNADDGGNRQCILVTNNENNICEEVTYERNKRVIQGYTNAKGVAVEGLKNNNLRYYKSEFVSRDTSLKNKRELTFLATELLCIKEDCYAAFPSKEKWFQAFTSKSSQFIVIYDEVYIEDSFEIIEALHAQKTNDNPVKVYVFSHGQYPYTEDFEEVLPLITLCALPDAIYKAYQNVLPKKKRERNPIVEEEEEGDENNLFNQDL